MLTLISLLVVLVGCANWLSIGLLQFDFVAGLFGSQSNVFSRIIYFLVGVAAIIITFNLIKNKGKLLFNFKKMKKEKNIEAKPALVHSESASDNAKQNEQSNIQATNSHNTEASNEFGRGMNYSEQAQEQHINENDNSNNNHEQYATQNRNSQNHETHYNQEYNNNNYRNEQYYSDHNEFN